jgi:hypothetical protein
MKANIRLITLVTAFLGALVVLASVSFSPTSKVSAAGDLDGVACSDIFLNRGLGDADAVVDANDLWVGASLARVFDPGGPAVRTVDVAVSTYLGPDLVSGDTEDYNLDGTNDPSAVADLVPDGPSVQFDCQDKDSAAQGAAENGLIHNRLDYATVGEGTRPNFSGTYDSGAGTLSYGTCDFSEALGLWIRQETSLTVDKGPGKSTGSATLFLGTSAPSAESPPGHATDYTTCTTVGSFAFPSVLRSDEREPSTDGTVVAPAVADPSPALDDSADGLSDDWDGDGCPDWDELALFSDPDQNGADPFNPQDCDTVIGGISYVQATAVRNTDNNGLLGVLNDEPGNGIYFFCLVDGQQTGGNITLTPFCYTDSTLAIVNGFHPLANNGAAAPNTNCGGVTPPPTTACGDGRSGPKPPKGSNPGADSYAAVGTRYDADAAEGAGTCGDELDGDGDTAVDQFDNGCRQGPVFDPTVLTGTVAGEIASVEGCFSDATGLTGPNVYIDLTLNVKTGGGIIDIWIAQPTCAVPGGAPTFNDAELDSVEFNTKAGITNVTKLPDTPPVGVGWVSNQTFGPTLDNDNDGCDTKAEILNSDPAAGGIRDPFNTWDLYDPTRDGAVAGTDFFAVLGRFGSSGDPGLDSVFGSIPAAPAYHTRFDRGDTVPGSAVHVKGAADGNITGVDFFSVLAQFGHTC